MHVQLRGDLSCIFTCTNEVYVDIHIYLYIYEYVNRYREKFQGKQMVIEAAMLQAAPLTIIWFQFVLDVYIYIYVERELYIYACMYRCMCGHAYIYILYTTYVYDTCLSKEREARSRKASLLDVIPKAPSLYRSLYLCTYQSIYHLSI